MLELDTKSNHLEKFRSDLKTEHNHEMPKHQAVKQRLYERVFSVFENTVGYVLCRYAVVIGLCQMSSM